MQCYHCKTKKSIFYYSVSRNDRKKVEDSKKQGYLAKVLIFRKPRADWEIIVLDNTSHRIQNLNATLVFCWAVYMLIYPHLLFQISPFSSGLQRLNVSVWRLYGGYSLKFESHQQKRSFWVQVQDWPVVRMEVCGKNASAKIRSWSSCV